MIYFEYDPSADPSRPESGLDAIGSLIDVGYSAFVYYDNFGHQLVHVGAQQRDTFRDLHRYLACNRRYGTAIHYFDVCAFHEEDADLAPLLRGAPENSGPADR